MRATLTYSVFIYIYFYIFILLSCEPIITLKMTLLQVETFAKLISYTCLNYNILISTKNFIRLNYNIFIIKT